MVISSKNKYQIGYLTIVQGMKDLDVPKVGETLNRPDTPLFLEEFLKP